MPTESTEKAPESPSRQRDTRLIVISVICGCAIGWFAATSPSSPIRPDQHRKRPVLSFLARIAKVGLWFVCVEPPPSEERAYVVHARVDDDGNRILNHGEGW